MAEEFYSATAGQFVADLPQGSGLAESANAHFGVCVQSAAFGFG